GQRGSSAASPPSSVAAAAPAATSASSGGSTGYASGKRSYRFRTAKERLPGDLPSWFVPADKNEDGQVAMSEYASAWSDSKVYEFDKYDLNGDGIITVKECSKAKGR